MRHTIAAMFATILIAGPVLADPPAPTATDTAVPAAKPKMKKICKAVNNGNPMFPEMKCHSVPVETADTTPPTQTNTQVAMGAPR